MDIVAAAIQDITGYDLDVIRSKSRKDRVVDARSIFLHERWIDRNKEGLIEAGKEIGITHSSVIHHLRRYNDLCVVEPRFRAVAERVSTRITELKSPSIQYESSMWICVEEDGRPIWESMSTSSEKAEEWRFENFSREIKEAQTIIIFSHGQERFS